MVRYCEPIRAVTVRHNLHAILMPPVARLDSAVVGWRMRALKLPC